MKISREIVRIKSGCGVLENRSKYDQKGININI